MPCNHIRCTRHHNMAARTTGARPHVQHPVAAGGHAHIVFDHDHRIARRHQALQLRIKVSTSAGCRPVVGSSST